jgi:transposase
VGAVAWPGPGRAFHVAFATQAQEAFLEGHVLAFEYFGAVPGRVRYDSLKPAVVRVLRGRDRTEAERFIALRSHYKSVPAGSPGYLAPWSLLAAA